MNVTVHATLPNAIFFVWVLAGAHPAHIGSD
jgi:hypothetical protein